MKNESFRVFHYHCGKNCSNNNRIRPSKILHKNVYESKETYCLIDMELFTDKM